MESHALRPMTDGYWISSVSQTRSAMRASMMVVQVVSGEQLILGVFIVL